MPQDVPVEVFIAVGSNIEPERNIVAALQKLQNALQVMSVSTMYRTPPLGRPEQPAFANGVWHARTRLGARELKFGVLRRIESELGRVRTADRYAARPIDLDIVLYGEEVIEGPDLVVPDPDILSRPFLAVPLLELVPDLRLPGSGLLLADQSVCRETHEMKAMPGLTERLRERVQR